MRKVLFMLGGTAVAAVFVLFGGVLGGSQADVRAPGPGARASTATLLSGFSPGDTAGYVAQLEARVAAEPRETQSLVLLGLAYQQRARETGDASFYPRSGAALGRAERLDPQNPLTATGLASLAASRHRFVEARRLADRARRFAPASAGPLAVLGDALVELGRYKEAFAAFDRMAALKPSLAAYSRVSYARELLGQPQNAIAAMRLAVTAGTGTAEPLAWALVQLGNLYFDTGRLAAAGHSYRRALTAFPDYVHAEAGLGRVSAARGRYDDAIRLYRAAVQRLPLPQYEGALGDVLRLAGRSREAREAYGTVGTIERLLEANGVRTELETALFDLDHDRHLADALARARIAYRTRKSIDGEDVLAWALYKNGRCHEALSHSRRALRLGTRDALKIFHHGMIEGCLRHRDLARAFLARALAINPHFSVIYAPIASKELR